MLGCENPLKNWCRKSSLNDVEVLGKIIKAPRQPVLMDSVRSQTEGLTNAPETCVHLQYEGPQVMGELPRISKP